MKVFSNFTSTDRKILGGSLLILLLLSYLLYDDSLLFPRQRNLNLEKVGTLSTLENDVRRKNSSEFIWLPSSKKDEIYNQDTIFTGDNSQASIQLNDGSVIQIAENSLVNINVKNGQMQLDLRFGQLTGTGKSSIRVKSNGDEYTIDGKEGKFEVNRSASGELDVKVLSGKAQIKGKKGLQDLKPNESLQISTSGVQKNDVQASIDLITAENTYFHRNQDKDPLPLKWSGKGPISQYQLEVSSDETFKKLNSLQMTNTNSLSVTDPLKEGNYFWRVKGLDSVRKSIATSKVQKFYVGYLAAPQFTSPQDNATLQVTALETEAGLKSNFTMSWVGNERVTKFHWQLSAAEEFSEIVSEKTLTTKSIQTPSLESGIYYARIRGFDKDDHPSDWSKVHRVHLQIDAEERPPAPKLVNTLTRYQIPTTGRAPSAEEAPKMEWFPVDEAKNYHWEIASNPRFVGAKTADTDQTKISVSQVRPGKIYYRVFARSELGQLSNSSEVGVIDVYGTQPVIKPIQPVLVKETNPSSKAPPQSVNVAWSPVAGAAGYTLQMDRSPEFTSPQQQDLTGVQQALTLSEPGKYFVRVKARNEMNQDISDYSKAETAVYNFLITLKTPVLLEPYNKTTVFLQKDSEPYVWLEWNAVPDSAKYRLEISTKPDFSKLILSRDQTETRYLIKEKIPYGNIYWRVKAISKDEGFSSEWAQWQFGILQQQNQGF